jgi:hypothetical protein
MSRSAKAFILLGEMLEGGVLEPAMAPTGQGAQRILSGLVKDQVFDQMGSEAEMPIVAIHGEGKHARTDEGAFRAAFNISDKPIQVKDDFTQADLQRFIHTNAIAYAPGEGFVRSEAAEAAALATTAVLRSLKDPKVFVTGTERESQRSTYIVGRAPDDTLVGIRTSVIWT